MPSSEASLRDRIFQKIAETEQDENGVLQVDLREFPESIEDIAKACASIEQEEEGIKFNFKLPTATASAITKASQATVANLLKDSTVASSEPATYSSDDWEDPGTPKDNTTSPEMLTIEPDDDDDNGDDYVEDDESLVSSTHVTFMMNLAADVDDTTQKSVLELLLTARLSVLVAEDSYASFTITNFDFTSEENAIGGNPKQIRSIRCAGEFSSSEDLTMAELLRMKHLLQRKITADELASALLD